MQIFDIHNPEINLAKKNSKNFCQKSASIYFGIKYISIWYNRES